VYVKNSKRLVCVGTCDNARDALRALHNFRRKDKRYFSAQLRVS